MNYVNRDSPQAVTDSGLGRAEEEVRIYQFLLSHQSEVHCTGW